MNKVEMIKVIAGKTGYTQKSVTEVVEAMVETIVDAVTAGEDVKISGFGAFSVTERAERVGRNPQDGSQLVIPASKSPRFKASKAFKDTVNA